MTVIGTVGHIDHGKTVLLRALTGIDADRLPEERRRGITIDVGYAHLQLPDGRSLDFVDLPGHHDLAGNFLVGVGEMDAALLVIAADSGPEAQTFEHLDVLGAFGLRYGVIAVTKIDRVDAARRAALRRDVEALVEGSALDGATVLLVSGRTGEGLDALRVALGEVDGAVRSAGAAEHGRSSPRLAVDRTFRATGHGLVATGSLRGGGLTVGDELRVLPGEHPVRVRRLQVHGHDLRATEPGGRVAVNVAGRRADAIRRGAVLTSSPAVVSTDRLLVVVDSVAVAREGGRVTVSLHIGTDHASAILSRLDAPATLPARGSTCDALLLLHRPVAAAIGDHFVLRIPSPPRLMGGGVVLDPAPPMLRRRRLRERLHAAPDGPLLARLLGYRRAMPLAELTRSAAALGVDAPTDSDLVVGGGTLGGLALAQGVAEELMADVASRVAEAGGRGVPISELRHAVTGRLVRLRGIERDDATRAATAILDHAEAARLIEVQGELAVDPARPDVTERLAAAADELIRLLDTERPPALSEAARTASLPAEVLPALFNSGRLVRVAPDMAFSASVLQRLEGLALSMAEQGNLSAAALRDAAPTSRRHAVAVLDALTVAGVLRRDGNRHLLGPRGRERLTADDRDAAPAHGGSR